MLKRIWIIGYLIIVFSALSVIASKTVKVDPYIHYHEPDTKAYFYKLNNERSQNDGIIKHFDYEGIITGTSMTQNFKASEAQKLFGVSFIKVPFSGGPYNEINNSLVTAASNNPKLKYVIRGLDTGKFFDDKDALREDLGEYPTYLYDNNLFNDAEYVFNRDVVFSRVYTMTKENDKPDFKGGITSFDDYSNWMKKYKFGRKAVLKDELTSDKPKAQVKLTQEDIDVVLANIRQNVTSLAQSNPNITFYYFFTPYSAAWWCSELNDGLLDRQIDAEKIVIEEILKYDNIKLFSFNCMFDITTDLNNYKDITHYGEWINSLMLRYMHDGKYQLTKDNYLSYLEQERQFYSSYDYSELNRQKDYKDDYYVAELLNEEIYGS
ncbi:MAG: hypothetical protein E7515_07085 [Ruminococcaceae bacterium]|nr:hypothetical protein [Oscillospiraceae bacterium]